MLVLLFEFDVRLVERSSRIFFSKTHKHKRWISSNTSMLSSFRLNSQSKLIASQFELELCLAAGGVLVWLLTVA